MLFVAQDRRSIFRTGNGLIRRWVVLVAGILVGVIFLVTLQNRHHISHVGKGLFGPGSAATSQPLEPSVERPTFVPGQVRPPVVSSAPHSTAKLPSKAIIAPVTDTEAGAADWIRDLLPDWQHFIYQIPIEPGEEGPMPDWALRPGKTAMDRNTGREASIYITYIIDHYDDLPDYMIFIHGKRYQTHNDEPMYDTYPLIRDLRLSHVEEEGYASLRCNWKECPKYKSVIPGHADDLWQTEGIFAETWQAIFPNMTMPDRIAGPCCAQFAVTRAAVRKWSHDDWVKMRDFIWISDWPVRSVKMGLVFEYLWHILFGKEAFYCKPAKDCYCKKWGLCDLDCPREGWCHGRAWLRDAPTKFPDGWPDRGQDGIDWPYWGWWNDPDVVKEH